MAMAERVPIGADMTAGELHDALARLGADLMVRALGALERGTLQLTPQPDDGVTYAAKIDKAETRIDWAKPWQAVHDHIRGLSPFPGAWFELPASGRVKVLRTTQRRGQRRARHGARRPAHHRLRRRRGALVEVQRAGRQPMKAEEFLRGTPVAPGTCCAKLTPCPATSSPSNMTARRSPAGRSRTTAPSVQGALDDGDRGVLRRDA